MDNVPSNIEMYLLAVGRPYSNKSIEEIKVEFTLKLLAQELTEDYILGLPQDDDLRIFICSFGPSYAYQFARDVDHGPHDVTRSFSCKKPMWAYWYAYYIDGKTPHAETRSASCLDPMYSYAYAGEIDKGPTPETREACYSGHPNYKIQYIAEFGE